MSAGLLGFGEFELDPVARSLRRSGALIDLQTRTLDLLIYFVHHSGEVVSRKELMRGVWGDVHVSDGALSTAIYEVRRAVGDPERQEPWLRTLRGRGFCFEADVRRLLSKATSAGTPGPP